MRRPAATPMVCQLLGGFAGLFFMTASATALSSTVSPQDLRIDIPENLTHGSLPTNRGLQVSVYLSEQSCLRKGDTLVAVIESQAFAQQVILLLDTDTREFSATVDLGPISFSLGDPPKAAAHTCVGGPPARTSSGRTRPTNGDRHGGRSGICRTQFAPVTGSIRQECLSKPQTSTTAARRQLIQPFWMMEWKSLILGELGYEPCSRILEVLNTLIRLSSCIHAARRLCGECLWSIFAYT